MRHGPAAGGSGFRRPVPSRAARGAPRPARRTARLVAGWPPPATRLHESAAASWLRVGGRCDLLLRHTHTAFDHGEARAALPPSPRLLLLERAGLVGTVDASWRHRAGPLARYDVAPARRGGSDRASPRCANPPAGRMARRRLSQSPHRFLCADQSDALRLVHGELLHLLAPLAPRGAAGSGEMAHQRKARLAEPSARRRLSGRRCCRVESGEAVRI